MSEPSKKMIVLQSNDGETFQVEESVAVLSQTIKHLIEDDCADNTIPLPNVTGKILSKVLEYCKRHVASGDDKFVDGTTEEADLKKFDNEFLDVDQDTLFDILLASNYLDVKSLLDLICQNVADMMKGRTPEEIRKIFHIKNDYTAEEEEEVRRENAWAFE